MQSHRSIWLLGALLFFALMLCLGAIPGEANALSDRFGDKFLHTLAYGFLCLLCYRGLNGTPLHRYAGSVSLIALFGLLDESVQHFLPYRNASLLDWCFDVGAACIVIGFLTLQARYTIEADAKSDPLPNPLHDHQRDSHHAK